MVQIQLEENRRNAFFKLLFFEYSLFCQTLFFLSKDFLYFGMDRRIAHIGNIIMLELSYSFQTYFTNFPKAVSLYSSPETLL